MQGQIDDITEPDLAEECRRLVDLCGRAASRLRTFINARWTANRLIPKSLSKDVVWPVLMSRRLKGDVVGKCRLALRLTIKSVWDYPKMQQRNLRPTPTEREKTAREIERIVAAATSIYLGKEPPQKRTGQLQ